ncbi:hypothetical protein [Bacteroides caecimuris]|uniref:hypothetical protein n=1 Tax=Bacteroides caecimuris TaxID=1796613 RepID=UPI00265D090D|nr:hypothetical protein [Bacteroides caecimuris]
MKNISCIVFLFLCGSIWHNVVVVGVSSLIYKDWGYGFKYPAYREDCTTPMEYLWRDLHIFYNNDYTHCTCFLHAFQSGKSVKYIQTPKSSP